MNTILQWTVNYLINIILGIDKLANCFAGGNNEITVSARCGHYAKFNGSDFWLFCAKTIDIAFYPFQGWGHCEQARKYERDRYKEEGPLFLLGIFVVGIVLVCMVISAISWGLYLPLKYLIQKIV